jgi:hypothetical protein
MTDPMANIEIEAVASVYPAVWAEFRAGIEEQQDALTERLSIPQLQTIGRNFALPLTVANVPGYGASFANRPDGQPLGGDTLNARFAAPTGATTSPSVTLEETPEQKRPYR